MKKKGLLSLFLIFAVGLMSLPAFAQDDEKLIQGTWRLAGTFSKTGKERLRAWFLAWTFSDGNFQLLGYPPINQKGKYRILKKDGDKLTLELYEQSGTFGKKDKQIEIMIDKEKGTLKIDGRAGFKRIEK